MLSEIHSDQLAQIPPSTSVMDTQWFTDMVEQLVRLEDFLVAAFTHEDIESEPAFAFMKAVLDIEDLDEIRQWNEKHAYGLPGFRCGINADGLLNVMLREAKAAWSHARPISMPH